MEHVGSQNGNTYFQRKFITPQMAQETVKALNQYSDVLGIFRRRSEK